MTQQACDYTEVEYSLNPVKTGQTFILSVTLHDFSHEYWGGFTHVEISTLTHSELAGDV